MTSRRIAAPTLSGALHALRDDVRELQRVPGQWIHVGNYPGDAGTLPESPPFQNGFSSSGGGFAPLRFRINKWRVVEIEGSVDGGSVGAVIFTLPAEYRPDYSLRFVCAGASATPTTIQVDSNGDVTQVA